MTSRRVSPRPNGRTPSLPAEVAGEALVAECGGDEGALRRLAAPNGTATKLVADLERLRSCPLGLDRQLEDQRGVDEAGERRVLVEEYMRPRTG